MKTILLGILSLAVSTQALAGGGGVPSPSTCQETIDIESLASCQSANLKLYIKRVQFLRFSGAEGKCPKPLAGSVHVEASIVKGVGTGADAWNSGYLNESTNTFEFNKPYHLEIEQFNQTGKNYDIIARIDKPGAQDDGQVIHETVICR